MLSAEHETELVALAEQYGAPRRVQVALSGAPFNPLAASDRVGEVCMVIRRPDGRLITAIKTFYPPGAFRLLTGGVAPGEALLAALLREVAEETGLNVAVRRLLAVIEYNLAGYHFATIAFLLDALGGMLANHDEHEQHAAFGSVAVAELPALADWLEQVPAGYHPEIEGDWSDWGRFRAVVHRVVHAELSAEATKP